MSKQQKETVTMALLMLFSGWFYCCYYYFVGTEFFSLLLLTSKTSNASETYTYQEERGTDSLACLSWVSSFLLRGAFLADYFTLIGNVGSSWHFIVIPCGLLEDSEVKPILPVKIFPFAVCLFSICFYCKCDTFKSKARQRCPKPVKSSQIFLPNTPLGAPKERSQGN